MLLHSSSCAVNSCCPHTHPISPKLSAPRTRVSRPDLSHGAVDGDKNVVF